LSPRDAAELLGISPDTLRRWERNGLIQAERTPGGQRRYSEDDLSTLLERHAEDSHLDQSEPTIVSEQQRPTRVAGDVPPWERKVREEQAELEVTKIRAARAALIRAERDERERREKREAESQRLKAAEAAERERIDRFEAAQKKRLADLRAYGELCAVWAPAEYQAKVARDLISSVNVEDYPPNVPDHHARAQVNARVEELLAPWKEGEDKKRRQLERDQRVKALILSGRWYAQSETRDWDRRDAERAMREAERAMKEDVDADWSEDDVRDLVDDVLDDL